MTKHNCRKLCLCQSSLKEVSQYHMVRTWYIVGINNDSVEYVNVQSCLLIIFPIEKNQLAVLLIECLTANQISTECFILTTGNFQFPITLELKMYYVIISPFHEFYSWELTSD